jgi:hypothetical protein
MGKIIRHELDWWENQNEDMDLAAKAHWATTHLCDQPTAASLSAFESWHVLYQNWKLSRVQVAHIYGAIYTPLTEDYWASQKFIRASAKRRIYWDGIGAAAAKLRPSKRRWMVKHTTKIYGYGKWIQRWNQWDHACCPCCTQRKDIQHIARCTHAGAVASWEQSLEKLAAWFSHNKTHPGVTQLLLARLKA